MVTSFLNARLKQPVTVLVYAPLHDDVENRNIDRWVPSEVIEAVVSTPTSAEIIGVGQELMTRQKIVRYFGVYNIDGKSKLQIDNEEYVIDGKPVKSRGVGGNWLTTIKVSKEGEQ